MASVIVDQLLNGAGVINASSITGLSPWVEWMNGAIQDALHGRRLSGFVWTGTIGTACHFPALTTEPTSDPSAPFSGQLILDLVRDAELLTEFCVESQEYLGQIEQAILVLESRPADAGTLETLFRAFHSFKGGAGFLNLHPIKELAHELESVLDRARTGELNIDRPVIEIILAGRDALEKFIDEISAQLRGQGAGAEIHLPTQALLNRIRLVAMPTVAERPAQPPQAGPQAKAKGSLAPDEPEADGEPAVGPVVKVDTLKLDSLIELMGELVIAQSQVCQDPEITSIESQRLSKNLAQLGRITKALQTNALALRMVPLRATFQKMTRLVRDVSAQLHKQAELILHGEETELDRSIAEAISDPLIHMIRNSVDHGLELPEDRLTAGKPPVGSIHLSASHRGGNIIIQIRDDGRGLDPQKLKARAIERSLLGAGECLTDPEAWALIFKTGFSTAESVTDISGRGVGMDIVRRNVEKLRGKIEIESTIGQGTTFTISLPLTMAIIDGLIVMIGEQCFVLPTLSVREALRPTPEMLSTVPEKGELVNIRGRHVPLLRAYEFYELKPRTTDPTGALLVMVEHNGESRCLMVDQLIGKQEVVIKSLGEIFKRSPALAGGCILGDGRVGLILDLDALVTLHKPKRALAA